MIYERIVKIIAKQLKCPENKITMDSRIAEDLGADSLDYMEMISSVENEFDISVDDNAAENLITVGDIVKILDGIIKK